jgi:3-dehydroquinate synthetase
MRGIDLYQVPTTLLAQVDSSVGGKTGVDLPQGKNLVGAFYQPRAVLIDTGTLDTLPVRELKCGLAEVVKHGIIYDQGFFEFLRAHAGELLARRADAIEHAVARSVEIKRDVVQADERESGIRAILNCGHTVGHAIEMLAGYGKYRHGEALSIGLVTEALLADCAGFSSEVVSGPLRRLLWGLGLPVEMDPTISTADIMSAVRLDKKVLGADLRLALPVAIGRCEVHTVEPDLLTRAIDGLREREAGDKA